MWLFVKSVIIFSYVSLGVIYVNDYGKEEKMPQFQCELHAVADEPALIAAFVALVRKWDPDIFVGYEVSRV